MTLEQKLDVLERKHTNLEDYIANMQSSVSKEEISKLETNLTIVLNNISSLENKTIGKIDNKYLDLLNQLDDVKSSLKTLIFFKKVPVGTVVSKPTSLTPDNGWNYNISENEEGYNIYMSIYTASSGWSNPVQISSTTISQGDDVEKDGWSIGVVYKRSNSTSISAPTFNYPHVSDNWTTSPRGINEEFKYEFISILRYKLNEFEPWSEPIIWITQGVQGVPGPKGDSGQQLYTWIRYADNAEGGNISNEPIVGNNVKPYIGFAYNKTTSVESNDPSDYIWSLIKGTDGLPGAPGDNGKTLYTWIKYSSVSNPTSELMTDNAYDPNIKYIGISVNNDSLEESNDPTKYVWSKFKGEDGKSVTIKGVVNLETELPKTGNTIGDGYIVDGILYIWDGSQWNRIGVFTGKDGQSVITSHMFKRSDGVPTDILTNEGSYINPSPVNEKGWTDGIPLGEDSIYMQSRVFTSDGEAPQQTSWGTPTLLADTPDIDICYKHEGNPSDLPEVHNTTENNVDQGNGWHNIPDENDKWMAISVKTNGNWSQWKVSKIQGETAPIITNSNLTIILNYNDNGNVKESQIEINLIYQDDNIVTIDDLQEYRFELSAGQILESTVEKNPLVNNQFKFTLNIPSELRTYVNNLSQVIYGALLIKGHVFEIVIQIIQVKDWHNPIIDIDGYWLFYDSEVGQYVKSDLSAKGDDGHSPYVGENGNWWEYDAESKTYHDTNIKAEASIPQISSDGYWIIDGEKTEFSAIGDDGYSPYVSKNTNTWWEYDSENPENQVEGERLGYHDTGINAEGKDAVTPITLQVSTNVIVFPTTDNRISTTASERTIECQMFSGIDPITITNIETNIESHSLITVTTNESSVIVNPVAEADWESDLSLLLTVTGEYNNESVVRKATINITGSAQGQSVLGPQGASIVGVKELYYATKLQEAPQYNESTVNDWSEKHITPTPEKPYIWNCELITFRDPSKVNDVTWEVPGTVHLCCALGNGIKSLSNSYAVTTTSIQPTEFPYTDSQDAAQAMSTENKYLWNKEHTEYTDGSIQDNIRLVCIYGDKGDTPTITIQDNEWYIDGIATGWSSKGDDGHYPYIGTNNHWFEYDPNAANANEDGYYDTGITAKGEDGKPFTAEEFWGSLTEDLKKQLTGQNGDSISVKYSASSDGSNAHDTFTIGDKYMQIITTTSSGTQSSNWFLIVGENGKDGEYTDYKFAWSADGVNLSLEEAPDDINESDWKDSPADLTTDENKSYLWMKITKYIKKLGEATLTALTPYYSRVTVKDGKDTLTLSLSNDNIYIPFDQTTNGIRAEWAEGENVVTTSTAYLKLGNKIVEDAEYTWVDSGKQTKGQTYTIPVNKFSFEGQDIKEITVESGGLTATLRVHKSSYMRFYKITPPITIDYETLTSGTSEMSIDVLQIGPGDPVPFTIIAYVDGHFDDNYASKDCTSTGKVSIPYADIIDTLDESDLINNKIVVKAIGRTSDLIYSDSDELHTIDEEYVEIINVKKYHIETNLNEVTMKVLNRCSIDSKNVFFQQSLQRQYYSIEDPLEIKLVDNYGVEVTDFNLKLAPSITSPDFDPDVLEIFYTNDINLATLGFYGQLFENKSESVDSSTGETIFTSQLNIEVIHHNRTYRKLILVNIIPVLCEILSYKSDKSGLILPSDVSDGILISDLQGLLSEYVGLRGRIVLLYKTSATTSDWTDLSRDTRVYIPSEESDYELIEFINLSGFGLDSTEDMHLRVVAYTAYNGTVQISNVYNFTHKITPDVGTSQKLLGKTLKSISIGNDGAQKVNFGLNSDMIQIGEVVLTKGELSTIKSILPQLKSLINQ